MWITQERYPQAHSHNNKNMLSQLKRRNPSGQRFQLTSPQVVPLIGSTSALPLDYGQ